MASGRQYRSQGGLLDLLKDAGPECLLVFLFLGLAGLNLFQGGLFQHGLLTEQLFEIKTFWENPFYFLGSRPFWHWPDLSVWLLSLCRFLPSGDHGGWVQSLSCGLLAWTSFGLYRWVFKITHHRWASVVSVVMFWLQWGVLRGFSSGVDAHVLMGLTVWMLVWLSELALMPASSSAVRHRDKRRERLPFVVGFFWFLTLFCGGVRVFFATGLLVGGYLLAQVRTSRDAMHYMNVLSTGVRLSFLLALLLIVLAFSMGWVIAPSLVELFQHIGQWWWIKLQSVRLLVSVRWWQLLFVHGWADFLFVIVRSFPSILLTGVLWLVWKSQQPYCGRLPELMKKPLFMMPWLVGGVFFSAWFPVASVLFFPLLLAVFVSMLPADLPLPHWVNRLWDGVLLLVLMLGLILVLLLGYGSILPPLEHEGLLNTPFLGWPVLGWLSWKGGLVFWVVCSMAIAMVLFAWSSKVRFRGAFTSIVALCLWIVFGLYGLVFPVFEKPLDGSFAEVSREVLSSENTVLAIDDGSGSASLSGWFPQLMWANIPSKQPVLKVRNISNWSLFWKDRLTRVNRRVVAVMRESTYYQLPTLMRHQSKVLASGWGWKPDMLVGQRAAYSGTVPVNLLHYLQGVRAFDRWMLVVYWPKRYTHLEQLEQPDF